MKHFKKILLIIVILAALSAGGFYWYQTRHPIHYQQGLYTFSSELAGKTIVQSDYIRYPGKEGKNAQELLKDAIGATELATPDKDHIWNLYVNAQKQSQSPDKVITKTGDIIEWVQQSTKEEIKF